MNYLLEKFGILIFVYLCFRTWKIVSFRQNRGNVQSSNSNCFWIMKKRS